MADPSQPLPEDETGSETSSARDRASEMERLRELLVGRERRELADLGRRLEEWELSPDEVAELLPDAIAQASGEDDRLAKALAPTLEAGIAESVHRNPQPITQAIYPILGPAIRKAISDTLSGFVDTLNRAIEHSFSRRGLAWRWEAWRTGVPYAEIVLEHALVYRVEQVFLIHGETGLLLGHAAVDESKSRDPDLVSGMLTAIRDFVGDSFEATDEGGLRTFKVGELTVLVEAGPRALLAAVVRGQPPRDLRTSLEETLETVHLQFRRQLAEFAGDDQPFQTVHPLLADLLETVVATDRPEERGRVARWAWIAVAVLLLVAIGWAVRGHIVFGRAVAALRSEPGITLLSAERGWGGWRFDGLRDPLARPPAQVVEGAVGHPADEVGGHWEPYLSFDPEIVLERARRLVAPPAGVELDLSDGRLVAHGTASARWAMAALARSRSLPGVSEIDLSGLEVSVPEDLEELRRSIESDRVLFALGSAGLEASALEALDRFARRMERLHEKATGLGYDTRLRLVGRTDSSGTEQTNRQLSEARARAVERALLERGVTVDEIVVEAVGDTAPLAAEPGERDRINRSVSFSVVLEGWTATDGDER